MDLQRLEIQIRGQVQGVGFRPCVYRIAKQLGLTGWVQNNPSGVLIEVQGTLALDFINQLKAQLPPLATVKHVQLNAIPIDATEVAFEIRGSVQGRANTIISPDVSICSDCLQELFDPKSRYFCYPFLNCSHCGPRYSITRSLPYDRDATTMDEFLLCKDCKQDYLNPDNRRYHAEPTACEACGPRLSLPIEEIVQSIVQGEIVALKGVGGYQLICDARNESALLKLRKRKNREAKPFALMVANTKSAELYVAMNDHARSVLESAARPIVLLRKKDSSLPQSIAPGLNHLGIMLPSTPLHYLLFNAFAGAVNSSEWLDEVHSTILVVTSANPGGCPLVIEDQSATHSLKTIADSIVSYNRQIINREDDSVLRIINGAPLFIRRSRGFSPTPIQLPYSIPTTIAVGGHLKNTWCITRGDEAFVSQHIGSLNNKETIEFFHESLSNAIKLLAVTPERMAHDMHPDFYTTRWAEQFGVPAFAIQHHHAHLASVSAEHGITQPVLGLALDGYGYGFEGGAWGGELLLLQEATFERLGCFYPIYQPGGERAAREPWRMGASVLHRLGRGNEIQEYFSDQAGAKTIHQLLDQSINCPASSSCGRLFDAASALLRIQTLAQYEGQAAMRLESLVTEPKILPNGWLIEDSYFNMMPTMEWLINESDPVAGANVFHGTLIAGLADWIIGVSRERRIDTVVLSGGCFLNQIVSEGLSKALENANLHALLPLKLPPNDGGISLGQAWIAGILGNGI